LHGEERLVIRLFLPAAQRWQNPREKIPHLLENAIGRLPHPRVAVRRRLHSLRLPRPECPLPRRGEKRR